jgi:uncharacterized membrane protein
MLIVFPLGLLGMAVIFDLIAISRGDADFSAASHLMIGAGILTGLAAAIFGVIDWAAIPEGTRAKRVGQLHGLGNVIIVALFAVAWFLRRDDPANVTGAPIVLEVVGLLGALVTGWLGGELVDRLAVGVDPGANLDAPSSLSGQPATTSRTANAS